MNITDNLAKNTTEVLILKRLILITAVIIYALFAISSFIAVATENKNSILEVTSPEITSSEVKKQGIYTLTESDGVIAVIYNESGKIIQKTDTLVSILPPEDQKKIREGIQIYNEKELIRLLEDFCS